MKKKVSAVLLAATLALSLTACGGEQTSTSNKAKTKTTQEQAVESKSQLDEYVGKPLNDTISKINELGYKATYLADGEDFTDFIDSVADDYLTGEIKEDPDKKTAEVTLELASNAEYSEMEKNLQEKLEEATAWGAANAYGKSQYGDGFDLNYLVGKIDASADDENTWFLKAECTVDGKDMTCESHVSGTTEDPKVVDLTVY